jgi:hypothetical protein
MQARRDELVLERQDGLDQAGDAGGRVEVTDVALHRAHGAVTPPAGAGGERLGGGGDLDGVPQLGARAVGLEVGDGLRRHLRDQVRGADDLRLSVHARRGVAGPRQAVVVGRRALDHRPDGIAVALGRGQPLEHHDPGAAAADRAAGARVERPAVTVGREDAVLLVEVAPDLREGDGDPSCQRHVALAADQRLACEVDRQQRGGAGALHHHARSLESQLVGDSRAEEILVVGDARLLPAQRPQQVGPGEQVEAVAVVGHPAVDPDRPGAAADVVARVLHGFPGALEEDPLLRVHDLRLARAVAEELRVEEVGAGEHAACPDVAGVGEQVVRDAVGAQLVVGEEGDRFDAVAEVAPQLVDAGGAGKAPGHADDRDLEPRPAVVALVHAHL